jgi:hypothetical protein
MRLKDEEFISLLRALKSDFRKINKTASLRPMIDEIEAAMALGATRQSICDVLSKGGIDMPLATLDSILYRHRKKQGRTKKAVPAGQGNATRQVAPVSPSSGKTNLQGTADPASPPKTGVARLNEIMRSTPDLAELARLTKEARRIKNENSRIEFLR